MRLRFRAVIITRNGGRVFPAAKPVFAVLAAPGTASFTKPGATFIYTIKNGGSSANEIRIHDGCRNGFSRWFNYSKRGSAKQTR
jgi:hypothetical protein